MNGQETEVKFYVTNLKGVEERIRRLGARLIQPRTFESNLRFAHHHHAIIEKYGRFPHRNAALGRDSTEAEKEYLKSKQAFTG